MALKVVTMLLEQDISNLVEEEEARLEIRHLPIGRFHGSQFDL